MTDRTFEPILVDRELTKEERELTEWILEHGKPRAQGYLNQLERLRVSSLCPCGCASVDFAVEGKTRVRGGIDVLGDFLYGEGNDGLCGAFVFADKNGTLAGLEVYGLVDCHPITLPSPSELRPFDAEVA